jgi:WD40 repeat protein
MREDNAKKNKKDAKKKDKKKDKDDDEVREAPAPISVNDVAAFQCQNRSNHFITVDDSASLKIWDCEKMDIVEEKLSFSNGLL